MGPQLYRCGNDVENFLTYKGYKASMGPQLYRCGNPPKTNHIRRQSKSFNGAATLSLRKSRFRRSTFTAKEELQWGRNFIVAEIWGPRALLLSLERCFNGAATLSLRKLIEKTLSASSEAYRASMGPQLYRCGNRHWTWAGPEQVVGFNGAATLSLRKSNIREQAMPQSFSLQWGRNFIVAEIDEHPLIVCDAQYWLQWGRNFIVAEISTDAGSGYTQGLKLQWGRNFIVAEMCKMRAKYPTPIPRLQWGRNFIVAEISGGVRDALGPVIGASMGPQLYRCGNVVFGYGKPSVTIASMGPQLYRCGNLVTGISLDPPSGASMGPQLYRCGNIMICSKSSGPSVLLQWGRNFIVAEMYWAAYQVIPSPTWLQWGRNFIVAEILQRSPH